MYYKPCTQSNTLSVPTHPLGYAVPKHPRGPTLTKKYVKYLQRNMNIGGVELSTAPPAKTVTKVSLSLSAPVMLVFLMNYVSL